MAQTRTKQVESFYDLHPINEDEILAKLAAAGADLKQLKPEQLTEYDQDHYGGVEAVATLAKLCAIGNSDHVLDVCSGMGGPARWLAYTHGCRVTGIDLTQSRVDSARRLTGRVGLDGLVDFVQGDATGMPFEDEQFDVCISEESWLHIPDKPAVVANCARVTRRTIGITDTTLRGELAAEDATRLEEGMSTFNLQPVETYAHQFEANGFKVSVCDDLSDTWTELLVERLGMFRSLRDTTVEKFGEAHFKQWDAIYEHYVGLFEDGVLGGVRIVGQKA